MTHALAHDAVQNLHVEESRAPSMLKRRWIRAFGGADEV
jgi:hypothetical protein